MRRSSRGSAGEESDDEWVEEHIEREESTESLDELGLPLSSSSSSSKTSSGARPSGSRGHLDSANVIVLDFGPSLKGRPQHPPLSHADLLLISRASLNCPEWLRLPVLSASSARAAHVEDEDISSQPGIQALTFLWCGLKIQRHVLDLTDFPPPPLCFRP